MFPCFTCGRRAVLIKGCCDACDPRAHREFAAWMALFVEYQRATGLDPLGDYGAFEQWVDRRRDLEQL